MLTALSAIVSAQAEPTEETMAHCKHFLNYASTHQAVILTYTRTNMVLVVHSDASYLPLRYGRPDQQWGCSQPSQLIKAVMSSTAEAELGTLYINTRGAIPQCKILAEMGHKQPPTPMKTNNSTALGVVNNNIHPQRTKVMDMRFHWHKCREAQCQFQFF